MHEIDFPPPVKGLTGLRRLARILYPLPFPEDPRPIVRDFPTRCYHRTPAGAELDQPPRIAFPAGA
ncbi:MAG: hypothetical protein IT529_07710 [Burkholderiales bacterium]|nr:hypothetical protein [Burkholderiales bacterium]